MTGARQRTARTPLKRIAGGILLAMLSLAIVMTACELAFRLLLFSSAPFMERFRNPSLYADPRTEDDWWKLYDAFRKPASPTASIWDPLLGWHGDFSEGSYQHIEASRVGNRRPLLLYGDSFMHCLTPASECFNEILNHDPAVSSRYYALNYGVNGFGVDQVYLLIEHSLGLFHDPYVVVGVYTGDLDRSVMSYFTTDKPYFTLESRRLVLHGIPVPRPPASLASIRPRIVSYLYRLWLHGNGRPTRLRLWLSDRSATVTHERRLNEQLLLEILQQIDRQKDQRIFIIFPSQDEVVTPGWKEQFLSNLFDHHGVPYFSAGPLIREDMRRTGRPVESYFIPGDGHPNGYQNSLISRAIEGRLGISRQASMQRSSPPHS